MHPIRRISTLFLAQTLIALAGAASAAQGASSGPVDAATAAALNEAKLPVASPRRDVALGFPRIAQRLPATGTVRFTVVFVDFADAPATRSPQSVFGLISPEAEKLFRELSYGRLNVVLEPSLQWRRMSRTSTGYGWPGPSFTAHRTYIQEALKLAEAGGVNFAASDSFLVIANPDATAFNNGPAFTAGRGNGVVAGGKTFENGATSGRDLLNWGYKWFNHEIGHALGLPDLYAFAGSGHRFVGDFSLMGLISGRAPEFLAWERWQLGWLDDDQVRVPPSGTSVVELTALETAGGLKLLVIPTGKTTAVAVENRQALGYDRGLTRTGPLLYFIDTAIRSGEGPLKILPLENSDPRRLNSPLAVGQVLTHAGVSVRAISERAGTVTLEVTRP